MILNDEFRKTQPGKTLIENLQNNVGGDGFLSDYDFGQVCEEMGITEDDAMTQMINSANPKFGRAGSGWYVTEDEE